VDIYSDYLEIHLLHVHVVLLCNLIPHSQLSKWFCTYVPDPARASLARRGNEKERKIKLVDFENLAPSPESLTQTDSWIESWSGFRWSYNTTV